MSTTIDNRVVEMRFDNSNFEKNVATSLSTLDKLKQRLNLTGASKGLENLDSAAKKVNMSGLGNAVETVHAKFSALEVMGVTALANITNQAVNAGKKIVSALTIDPIKTGFQEYETQINAVQTILANTSHNGTTIDEVNKALDTLNAYADKTIYNFTEMTRNIGTFTAAGVDLQTSVDSIQGIANLAAVSGSTSQQASTAMYQLSQALAAGKVSLMDWNSVVNAGMGGKVFQDALVRTSELLKTGARDAIDSYGSFRESLTKGEWLTTEVLTETLKQFSGAYSEADLIAQGFTEEQAKDIASMAKTAEEAATKVKTFTQLWDVLKESAQSGWTQTWEILIGDFEEAKSLLTPLADFFTNAINKMSDARNKLLEGALGKTFTSLVDNVRNIVEPIKNSADSVKEVVDSVKNYAEIVDEIIGGNWGNGQERWDKLTEAGYDWAHAQNLVNEKLGSGVRHATEYAEAQEGVADSQDTASESQKKMSKSTADYIVELTKMSDAQLKEKGYTDDQIKAFRELADAADKTGIPLKEFITNIDEIDGRYLIFNGFKNIGQSIVAVFTAMAKAWRNVFPPVTSDQLFNVIAGFHKLTTYLEVDNATAVKLKQTFRGVFAALDIVSTLVGGPLKIAFKVLTTLLGYFDMDILDLTASIGNAIYRFDKWLDSTLDFSKALDVIIPAVKSGINAVKSWIDAFSKIPAVQKIIEKFRETFASLKDMSPEEFFAKIKNEFNKLLTLDASQVSENVREAFAKIKNAINEILTLDLNMVGKNIIEGLKNGIGEEGMEVVNKIIQLGKNIIIGICEVLGIHSPSTEFFTIGENIIQGLINGLINGISKVVNVIKGLASNIIEAFGNIDWGKIFAAGMGAGMLATLYKFADAISSIASPFESLGGLFDSVKTVIEKNTKNIGKVLKSFSKVMNSFAFSINAKAFRNIAISLAIVIGALVALAYLINNNADLTDSLWEAVKIIGVLAAILAALSLAVGLLNKASIKLKPGEASIQNFGVGLLGIAASLALVAVAVKLMGSMEYNQFIQGLEGLAAVVAALGVFLIAYFGISKYATTSNVTDLGSMLIKISVAMLLLVGVIKLIGRLSPEELIQGGIAMAAFAAFVAVLAFVAQGAGPYVSELGGMLIKMSIAMLLLVGVIKLIGMLSPEELIQGGIAMAAFVIFVATLAFIVDNTKSNIPKLGGMLIALSVSLLLLVGVTKLIGMLSPEEMIKGGIALAAFTIFIAALAFIVDKTKSDIPKLAGTLIAMGIAIGILAGVSIILSLISIPGLIKGIIAVGFLSLFMAMMIRATEGASDCKGNLIAMTVAIGIMAAAVIALSFIKPDKLAGATAALGILMFMFATMAAAAGSMQKTMGSLIVMTVAIALLGGLLYLLAGLPIESTLGAAAALSILMLSMSVSMAIISKLGTMSGMAMASIIVMTVVVVALGAILWSLQDLPVESSLAMSEALSKLLLSMSAALVILGVVGMMAPAVLAGMGSLAILIAGLGVIIAALGALNAYVPDLQAFLDGGIAILEQLGYGLGSFVGNIVKGFASGVAESLPMLGTSLSQFMINVTPFIVGIKMVDASMLEGVGVLTAAILALTAADLINGVISFVTGGFADLGTELSGFIINAAPFISGIKSIDPAAAEGAKALAEMILILTAADVLSGLTSWITGGSSLADFGSQLVPFGTAMAAFSAEVSGKIDEGAVTAAASAGKIMAEMQTSIYGTGGIIQWFCGEKNFETFGTQLVAFGKALVEFSGVVSAEGAINETAITAAANAGKIMTDMQSNLVNTGGVIQWFCGEKDMATFGTQLVAFGKALVEFSGVVGADGALNEEAILAAANAGSLMSELQNSLEPIGGVVEFFTGQKSLSTFGTQILAFGQALVDFSTLVGGEEGINDKAIDAAAKAGTIMAELQKSLPEEGWFDGKLSLDDFGKKIKKFGEGVSDYSEEVSDVNVDAVSSSITAANRLVTLTRTLVDLDASGIENFKVKSIGEAIKGYYDKISGIDAGIISSSISSAQKLASFIRNLKGLDSSGIASFKTAITSLSSIDFSSLEKAFSGSTSKFSSIGSNMIQSLMKGMKSKQAALTASALAMVTSMHKNITSKSELFRNAGVLFISKFVSGIVSQIPKATSSITTLVSTSVTSIKAYYDDFYSAGSYLVDGFSNGILNNSYKAEVQAAAMAAAAVEAAEEALGINSPSKVFYGIGGYTVQGFVNAISDNAKKVYKAGSNMAESAKDGLSSAISKIADIVNGNIDTQPTIRPVIDLDDVKSGVSTINGMLQMGSNIGVSTNIRAISSMMNKKVQNGGNDDVVSAINKLRDSLNNTGNTYNTIDGITYDDGSNISNLLESLVREAKMERRR